MLCFVYPCERRAKFTWKDVKTIITLHKYTIKAQKFFLKIIFAVNKLNNLENLENGSKVLTGYDYKTDNNILIKFFYWS